MRDGPDDNLRERAHASLNDPELDRHYTSWHSPIGLLEHHTRWFLKFKKPVRQWASGRTEFAPYERANSHMIWSSAPPG